MRVAAVNWRIRPVQGVQEFLQHREELVQRALDRGAQLVVLPELHVLELLSSRPDLSEREGIAWLADLEADLEWTPQGAVVVDGSQPVWRGEGKGRCLLNVCKVRIPSAGVLEQPKLVLTQYERKDWGMKPGDGLSWFEVGDHKPAVRAGVTVCYDCEFPDSGRELAEEGVQVQVVPAFTETRYGFQRVRWSCQARAVENQVFVIHASLTGSLGREPVPQATGSSAVLCPSIEPFPVSAVLAETPQDEEGIAVAELDFAMQEHARSHGDVRNWQDRYAADWRVVKKQAGPS